MSANVCRLIWAMMFGLAGTLALPVDGADVFYSNTNAPGRRIIMAPLQLTPPAGTSPLYDRISSLLDTNGYFCKTNCTPGLWQVLISAPPDQTSFTILAPTNFGLVNMGSITVATPQSVRRPQDYAYSSSASDARFAPIGTTGGDSAVNAITNTQSGVTLPNPNLPGIARFDLLGYVTFGQTYDTNAHIVAGHGNVIIDSQSGTIINGELTVVSNPVTQAKSVIKATELFDRSNVKFWGAKGENGDDTASLQAMIDASVADVYFPEGVYRSRSLNLVGRYGLKVRGAGPWKTIFIPIEDDYPLFDCSGGAHITFEDFQILSTNSLPSTGILWGRVAGGISAGNFTINRLLIRGSFRVAGGYTIASEGNSIYDSIFGWPDNGAMSNPTTNALAPWYSAKSATNVYWTPIRSHWATLTDDGSGGNSFNNFYNCTFQLGDTNPGSACLILEYGHSHSLKSCYTFSRGATNQIVVRNNEALLSIDGLVQEATDIFPNYGIWFGDAYNYSGVKIETSSVFPIGAVESSALIKFNFSGSSFNGASGVTNGICFDADQVYESYAEYSPVQPYYVPWVAHPRFRIRSNLSHGNTFKGIEETNLMAFATNSTRLTPTGKTVMQRKGNTETLLELNGGDIADSIPSLATNTVLNLKMANPTSSLAPGYTTSGMTYWQSFINSTMQPGLIGLNPYGGYAGIGTTSPQATLDVYGSFMVRNITTLSNNLQVYGAANFENLNGDPFHVNGGRVATNLSTTVSNATLRIDTADPTASLTFGYLDPAAAYIQSINNVTKVALPMILNPYGTRGFIGINTNTPHYELEVNGTINAGAILVNGSAVTGGSADTNAIAIQTGNQIFRTNSFDGFSTNWMVGSNTFISNCIASGAWSMITPSQDIYQTNPATGSFFIRTNGNVSQSGSMTAVSIGTNVVILGQPTLPQFHSGGYYSPDGVFLMLDSSGNIVQSSTASLSSGGILGTISGTLTNPINTTTGAFSGTVTAGGFIGNANGLTNLPGVINATDFGVNGNGVYDNAPALNAALTAASGRTLYLRAGKYRCNAQIILPSVQWIGDGGTNTEIYFDNSFVQPANHYNCKVRNSSQDYGAPHPFQTILLRGLYFHDSIVQQTISSNQYCIMLGNTVNSRADDCIITSDGSGSYSTAVTIDNWTNLTFQTVTVNNLCGNTNFGPGFMADFASPIPSQGLFVKGCTFLGTCWDEAFVLGNLRSGTNDHTAIHMVRIIDNQITGSPAGGQSFVFTIGSGFDSPSATNCVMDDVIVSGNTISGSNTHYSVCTFIGTGHLTNFVFRDNIVSVSAGLVTNSLSMVKGYWTSGLYNNVRIYGNTFINSGFGSIGYVFQSLLNTNIVVGDNVYVGNFSTNTDPASVNRVATTSTLEANNSFNGSNSFAGQVRIGTANTPSGLAVNGPGTFSSSVTASTLAATNVNDGASLGTELMTAGLTWTIPSDWSSNVLAFSHTNFATAAGIVSNSYAAAVNSYYQVTYTIWNRTNGTVTPSFGGVVGSAVSASGAYGPRAVTTGGLIITPTTNFDGTVLFSVKLNSPGTSGVIAYDTSGNNYFESRGNQSLGSSMIGFGAGRRVTTGIANTAQGTYAQNSLTTGSDNTAHGYGSQYYLTTGNNNTAQGMNAHNSLTTGNSDTAQGSYSQHSLTTGNNDTAQGTYSQNSLTTGNNNTAGGYSSQYFLTVGNNNTAQGMNAQNALISGSDNTAQGVQSQYSLNTGSYNDSQGGYSLRYATNTSYATTIGYNAGSGASAADNASSICDQNPTFIGANSGRDPSVTNATPITNAIAIGYNAKVASSHTAVIGGTGADAVSLIVNGNGTFGGTATATNFTGRQDGLTNAAGQTLAQQMATNNATPDGTSAFFDANGTLVYTNDVTGASSTRTTNMNANTSGTMTANGFISGSSTGISTTWTNLLPGLATNRLVTVGGLVVSNTAIAW